MALSIPDTHWSELPGAWEWQSETLHPELVFWNSLLCDVWEALDGLVPPTLRGDIAELVAARLYAHNFVSLMYGSGGRDSAPEYPNPHFLSAHPDWEDGEECGCDWEDGEE